MAGVMSAIMHAPLTSIFLIAEITGGYNLLLPLIITSLTAYVVKYKYDKYSVYTYNLSLEDNLITHNKDQSTIKLLNITKLIETNFPKVNVDLQLLI
jgi:CIC family chloride channel protein